MADYIGYRRIFAGYYKCLTDGLRFYVVDVVKDLETEQEVVICKKASRKEYRAYFTLTREAFCAKLYKMAYGKINIIGKCSVLA